LRVCFETLTVINQLYKDKSKTFGVNPETFASFRNFFKEVFTNWLGLKSESDDSSQAQDTIDGLMKIVLEVRNRARKDKNWPVADLIRNELSGLEIKVEDTPDGTDWYYEK
jgi:cysteinyl-tRNA synthetase